MDRLWAPWRMNYIRQGNHDGCFLCEKIKDEDKEKNYVLFQNSFVVVLLNIFPYNNGHLLIAPSRHCPGPEDFSPEETLEFWNALNKSLKALKESLKPEGFNMGVNLGKVAGAGLESHFHFHIVPRWSGDTNFMPVLGEVKVLPQHLFETFRALKPFFEEISFKENS